MSVTIVTPLESIHATETLGELIGMTMQPRSAVVLIGEMGAGKTVLSRGAARAYGVRRRVTSPTFLTIRQYTTPKGILMHCDLFRVESDDYLEENGVLDLLADGAVAIIEWGDPARLPAEVDVLTVSLTQGTEEGRRIAKITTSSKWGQRLSELVDNATL